MAMTPAQKQAKYRQSKAATHMQVNVFLPRDLTASAARKALDMGLTMSDLVTIALEAYIKPNKR